MKILLFIVLLGIIYRINKFILGIQISKSNNRKKENKTRKSKMDIMDGDYEEIK